jgi:nitronate monooxygenase
LVCGGQCVGLIDDIPTCADLIARMVSHCQAQARRTLDFFR